MSAIRILMVLDNTGRGGSQSFVMNVIRHIDRHRFQIDIAITRNKRGGYDEEMERYGCRIYSLEHFNIINYTKYVACWNRFLTENKYDIIHGNVSGPAVIYLRIAQKHGCATILHSHSSGRRGNVIERLAKRLLESNAKKYADLWFACSPKAAIRLFGKGYASNRHYHFVPNAIDISRYQFDDAIRKSIRAHHDLSDKTLVCGHVGSFSRPKNHQFLLRVFKQLHTDCPDSKLILVGDGYLREDINGLVESLGLKDAVIMTGNIGNVHEYLMAMDIMIFPSLFEGFGLAVLEAQASGLSCVVSDTVPDDIALSDLIHFVSLQSPVEKWVDTALKCSSENRVSYNALLADTQYNIATSISNLEQLYTSLVV